MGVAATSSIVTGVGVGASFLWELHPANPTARATSVKQAGCLMRASRIQM